MFFKRPLNRALFIDYKFLTDRSAPSSNAKHLEPHSPTEEGPVQKPVLGGLFSSKIQNFAFVSIQLSVRLEAEKREIWLD